MGNLRPSDRKGLPSLTQTEPGGVEFSSRVPWSSKREKIAEAPSLRSTVT